MSPFEKIIAAVKEDVGMNDQERFFQHLIASGLTCSFNDFQNMAMEREKPSQNLIETLLSISDTDAKDAIVKAYCEILFPKNYQATSEQSVKFLKQKINCELTEYQVSELAKSKIHYYLFLILVLKADKIKANIIKKQFGNLDAFDVVIEDLVNSQVLIRHNGYIYSVSPNVKFPAAASSDKLKKFYQQFDDWDKSFPTTFSFEKVLEKTIIRRISTRHLPIIQKQLENVLDTIRTSETSLIQRDQEPIVFLQLNFSKGK